MVCAALDLGCWLSGSVDLWSSSDESESLEAACSGLMKVYGLPRPSEEGTRFKISRTLPESQGRNLVLTVLHVQYSPNSGRRERCFTRIGHLSGTAETPKPVALLLGKMRIGENAHFPE